MIQVTFDQFTRVSQELIEQMTQERAEIEGLHASISREQEDVNAQKQQTLKERSVIMGQVQTLKDEREKLGTEFLQARQLKATSLVLQTENEKKQIELSNREKMIVASEKSLTILKEWESKLKQQEADIEIERQFLKKQQDLLDEKQQSLVVREKNITIKEERLKRVGAI